MTYKCSNKYIENSLNNMIENKEGGKMVRVITPDMCWLVLIVKDAFSDMSMIYFLDEMGKVIEYKETRDKPQNLKIDHLYVLDFTTNEFYNMLCDIRFNCIFEPNYIEYDNVKAWNMTKDEVYLTRFLSKIKHINNYKQYDDFKEGDEKRQQWINNHPTPIEQKNEEIHQQGIESRVKFLNYIEKWLR